MFDLTNFSDAEASAIIKRALRLVAIMAVIVAPIVWWKMGWQSATLLLVGAAISALGLWKWLRLMTTVIALMDAAGSGDGTAKTPTPLGRVLAGFFLMLALMLAALYGSLKLLDGSVYALFAGLGMGIVALTIEAVRTVKAWTT
ncbi:hypothetical protein ACFQBQ_01765 [Granulicella cerasi]|uniref:Uncharacterized protein n=1 Tax=Granulicella cerasi TaxID=741063 RepID=A0ABW1Z639_9BACT|nr:hypothetical protein [Granulicella cerasi]